MRTSHDDWMHQDFEEHPLHRPRQTGGWWVAAAAAVLAVVGVSAFLSVSPSAAGLQAAQDRGMAQARAGGASPPTQSALVSAATSTGALRQAQIGPRAGATEAAAQAGAASATAAARDASATAAATQP